MATLLKFKLLATHCTTAKSPSRPPAAASSRRRRRPTLQNLLARSRSRGRGGDRTAGDRTASMAQENNMRVLLRDHLLASPPPLDANRTAEIVSEREFVRPGPSVGPVRRGRRLGPVGFWFRMMVRRSWRPVLVTIPEGDVVFLHSEE